MERTFLVKYLHFCFCFLTKHGGLCLDGMSTDFRLQISHLFTSSLPLSHSPLHPPPHTLVSV